MMFSALLFTDKRDRFQTIPRQPYVRLMSKSNITRKETSLSCNFLRDLNNLKLKKFVSKAMQCFLENIWLRCGDYVSKMTSKSSNTKNAALHMAH